MASNTAEHDAWIADVFGLDVSQYATVPEGPAAQPSPGQASSLQAQPAENPGAAEPAQGGAPSAGPPAGGAPAGGAPAGGTKPGGAPPAGDGKAAYEAALKAIEDREHAATADVSAGEIAGINKDLVEPAKALATSDKHDYAGAMALLAQASKRLDVVELHKRRYEAGLKVAESYFNGLTARARVTPLSSVSTLIASIAAFSDGNDAPAAVAS